MSEIDTRIQAVLDDFRPDEGVYQQQAVDEALALQTEITPHLIHILEEALAHPTQHFDDRSHIYAFMLLGYFKEARAHRVILDLFSLPKTLIDPLYGDLITEDLPMVLFRTSDGSMEGIKELILNRDAYEYCRTAGITALTYAAIDDVIAREAVFEFLSPLFTGDEDAPGSGFWSNAVSAMCDLYPAEMMPVIEKAFEDDLIDPFFLDREWVQTILDEGKEATLAKTREMFEQRSLDDIHAAISWWAMFRSEERLPQSSPAFAPPPPPPPKPQPKLAPKQKAKKKKKRKMAKASKKKNRQRKK